jgi:hypothetical protein
MSPGNQRHPCVRLFGIPRRDVKPPLRSVPLMSARVHGDHLNFEAPRDVVCPCRFPSVTPGHFRS